MKTVQHAYVFLNCWINQNMHTRLDSYKDCAWEETRWTGVLKPLCWGLEANMLVFLYNGIIQKFHSLFWTPCSVSFKAFWVLIIIRPIHYAINWVCFSMSTKNPMTREYVQGMRKSKRSFSLSLLHFLFYLTCTEEVACTLFSFYITPALSTSKGLHHSYDMKGEGHIGY